MKSNRWSKSDTTSPVTAFVFLTAAAMSTAFAADVVWDGNTDSDGGDGVTFDSGLNWSTDVAPSVATPDNGVFDGTVAGPLALGYGGTMNGVAGNAGFGLVLAATQTGAVSIDSGAVATSLRLGGISIASGAGALTLGNGADAFNITLGGGASTQTFTNNSTNPAVVSSDVVFGLGGAANHLLHFTGSGNWSLASNMAFASGGQGAIYKTGTGTLTLTGGGALKEGITVNGGTIYSAVMKEGTTVFDAGTYSHNGANNGEVVVGGLDTVGTNTQVMLNNATAWTGVDWLSVGRGNGVGTTSSDLTLNNTSSIAAAFMSGGYNGGNAATAPKGTITLNGSSSIAVANTINLAESAGSNITLNVNGTSTFSQTANANQTRVGMANGSIGTVQVNGGTASFHRDLTIGYDGTSTGKLVINSGTVHMATTVERWLKVGELNGSSGQVDVNGGTLNLNTNTDLRFTTSAAAAGTNVVNLNSGAITGHTGNNNGVPSLTSVIDLNQASTSTANNTFNLNGGTLTIGQVITNNNGATTAFNFNGGTLKASGTTNNFVDLGGASQTVNVLGGGAIVDSNGFNVRIVDPLLNGGGGGGLSKLGAGTLTISGANTFTGPISITGGAVTLADGGSIASTGVTVNGAGAKFAFGSGVTLGATAPVVVTAGTVDGNGDLDSLTVADLATNTVSAGNGGFGSMLVDKLTFQGDARISLRATGSAMDQYVLSNTLTTSPANGVITVDVTNTTGLWTGQPSGWKYVIIDHAGGYAGNVATDFALGTLTPALGVGQSASIQNTGMEIVLVVTGDPLSWTGSASANWNTTQNNWANSGGPTTYAQGQSVLFEDGAGQFNVNLALNVEPGLVQFSNQFDDYTISSTGGFGINGAASLAVDGGGLVTILTDNAYTGITNIVDGAIVVSGTGSINDSSSISLGNLGELVFDPTGSVEYANPITGSGSPVPFMGSAAVTKQGAGILTLSGASTFTGSFALESGQLNLNSAGALGGGAGPIRINGGILDNTSGGPVNMTPNKPATLNSNLSFIGSNNLYLSNGGVTLTGSRTVEVQNGIFGMGAPADGGAGHGLTKTGPGTLVLNGGNIRGNLDVQSGIVGVNQDFLGGAPIGTGILQNAGNVGTKWTFWYGPGDVSSNLLIRDNDGTNLTQLGIVKRGSGVLTLTNPSNNTTANLSVDAGTLVLQAGSYKRQAGDGSTLNGGSSVVGFDGGANGILTIDGATVNYNLANGDGSLPYHRSLDIGLSGTGAGTVRLVSGSLSTYRQLAIGWVNDAFAGYTQTGGNATVGGFVTLGVGGSKSVMNLKGGTFTHNGPMTASGNGAAGVGIVSLSGTAAYNCNNTSAYGFWIGENGRGELNLSDSAALTLASTGSGLTLANAAGSSGVVNLRGGTLTTKSVVKGGGTGVLNFHGGILAANAANATYLTGLTGAYVHAGGGTIHNGGNAITIGQALLAPTGNGVSAAGLSAGGSGFIDTPVVTITGDGTGATAVANVDAAGNLTGITITNPGIGYTTAPGVALTGGGVGNTGSVTGTASLVPNPSGGLSFTGAAVTTLTGVNTYSGNTTIGSGTTVVVANAAALTVAPTSNMVSSKITGSGTVSIDGTLRVDLSGAGVANGNAWTLVDATPIYNAVTFRVSSPVLGDFVAQGDGVTHLLVDGNNTWSYSETSGVLSLSVAAGGGYETWIGGFGLPLADQDPTDDPDNDGMENELEYALGRNPSVAEGGALTGSKSGSNLLITFERSDLAVSNGDVVISVEHAAGLGSWSAPVVVPATSSVVGGITFTITDGSPNDTVVASIPTGGASEFFGRIRAVK